MEHVRHAHVGDEFEAAEDFLRNILPRKGRSDHGVGRGILRLARSLDVQRKSLARDLERVVQIGAGRQLAVCDALRTVALDAHDAVVHVEIADRRVQPARRQLQQQAADGRRGIAQRFGALADRRAAADAALIRGPRRVAHHERHAIGRDIQLLGDDLRERGFDAHADFHFAGEDVHEAVPIDPKPRVEPAAPRWQRRRRRRRLQRRRGQSRDDRRIDQAEADEQTARVLEKVPPGDRESRGHGYALLLTSPAARRTAANNPAWLPHRHTRPSQAVLICCSVGRGLRSSSTFAVNIQPFRQ